MKKLRIGIIFGGKTAEHEISLQSAKNIINKINKDLFDVVLLKIDKYGNWYINNLNNYQKDNNKLAYIAFYPSEKKMSLVPYYNNNKINLTKKNIEHIVDVIFPIIHGSFGEDGSLQGMFRMINLPFVGSDVKSSAICMDKDITKRLLRDAGFHVTPFVTLTKSKYDQYTFSDLSNHLGLPLFIKPANQGSSIGIRKVNKETQFLKALSFAFKFDDKLLVEKNINGREIECAILGNEHPEASICGEIVLNNDFYSYSSKYVNTENAKIQIPAEIDSVINNKIREISIDIYQILGCCGMARVDVFLTKENKILINEVNTLPGFSDTSMYPKLWEFSGINYSNLITRLIELALERYIKDNK